jgi:HK97 family phage prohead protease
MGKWKRNRYKNKRQNQGNQVAADKNSLMEQRKINQPQHNSDTAQVSDVERRFITEKVEYRASEDGGMGEVFGYALKFGVEYDMGDFVEVIARGALDKADMADVRILDNHQSHLILGRTKSGTASIGIDNVGLWYRASLPNSPNGQNMRESLLRGDIDQSSWGFQIRRNDAGRRIGDSWEKRDGKEYRTIHDVSIVFDASPVTFPANPDTSAAKRSRDEAFSEQRDSPQVETREMDDMPEEIACMVDNVAWATWYGNNMVSQLNRYMSQYSDYATENTTTAPVFAALAESCQQAKTALVAFIDGHIDALKTPNNSEFRASGAEPEPNTNNTETDTVLMQLQLEEARFKLNKLKK